MTISDKFVKVTVSIGLLVRMVFIFFRLVRKKFGYDAFSVFSGISTFTEMTYGIWWTEYRSNSVP